ncbi:MAG: prepilin peptidase, partial [Patescibacteria group bacterium]
MSLVLIFIFGLMIGSFLNVAICRLETKEKILISRSHCPRCGTILKWFELIPILSFLIQKGRCRYCGKRISFQYPMVEIFTGLLFFLIFNFQFSIFNKFSIFNFQTLELFYYFIIVSFLIVIFVYDLKHYLIPDKIVFPAIIIVLLFNLLNYPLPVTGYWLLAALAASGFFLILV